MSWFGGSGGVRDHLRSAWWDGVEGRPDGNSGGTAEGSELRSGFMEVGGGGCRFSGRGGTFKALHSGRHC